MLQSGGKEVGKLGELGGEKGCGVLVYPLYEYKPAVSMWPGRPAASWIMLEIA